jgi:phosphoribosylformylglycinamidine synthase subunit PurQ / glutaminase
MTVRSLVLTGFGINCEEEMAAAYRLAGAAAEVAHINQVFSGRTRLGDYQILNLPGGFSFGDDLGSGKVLANKLKYRLLASGRSFSEELQRFLGDGGYVLGVCNGFQALVKMGLLPNLSGRAEQEVSLARNDSGRFEDRWVRCKVTGAARSPFLAGLDSIELPVRHGEGKLVIGHAGLRDEILRQGLNCLTYCDEDGQPTSEYPANPNGSELACAGLTDTTGQILGIMPHPEAYLALYNHPDWPARRRDGPGLGDEGAGLAIFRNIVARVEGRDTQRAAAASPAGRAETTEQRGGRC